MSVSAFSLENDCKSLCIVKTPGLEVKSISDFLRRLFNILLASKGVFLPKMATATSVLKFSGTMLKEINASFSCSGSLWNEDSKTNFNR